MTPVFQIVADIGGTHARFACAATGGNELLHVKTLKCADYPQLDAALRAWLAGVPAFRFDALCLALACPVEHDLIRLTNNDWSFSRAELAASLGCKVLTINDFTAQASCLDLLRPDELEWWGQQRPRGGRMRVVLGPGTGLGVAGLSPSGDVFPTEGGHITFAPSNRHEIQLLDVLWNEFERVSIERLLSGPGLSALYKANALLQGKHAEELTPEVITGHAHQGDYLCLQTVHDFLDILAAVAGDYVLATGALDGVYLTGGILPQLGTLLDRDRFREKFAAKGRMQPYCTSTPLALIKAENTGLRGCLAALRRTA